MPEEHRSIPTGIASSATPAAAHSSLPFPRWKLVILGVVSCILWLGAAFGDMASFASAQAGGAIPVWLRVCIHVVLVLAPSALAIVWLRSPRTPATRQRVVYAGVAALALLVLAIPALLPYNAPQDLVSMPLRVPTLSLGVALALVGSRLATLRKAHRDPGASPVVVVGLSFGFACIAAAIVMLEIAGLTSRCNAGLACGGLSTASSFVVCGEASFCLITGVAGAWIGYAVGGLIAKING